MQQTTIGGIPIWYKIPWHNVPICNRP